MVDSMGILCPRIHTFNERFIY